MPYIIREVELEDFISHEKTRLQLGPGITVLIGENGAGKSSIVDAIYYLLTLPQKGSIRGGRSNLVRRNSRSKKARIRVTLWDQAQNRGLEVVATIPEKGNTSVEVYEVLPRGRRMVARKMNDARKEIARALGIGSLAVEGGKSSLEEVVESTVVLRQGKLAELINLFSGGSSERKKKFLRRIFGLEAYQKAQERMRDLRLEIDGEEVQPTLVNRLLSEIRKKQEEIEEEKKKAKQAEESLEELNKQFEKASKEHDSLIEKRRELEEKRDAVFAAVNKLVGEYEQEKKAIEQMESAKEEYEKLGCPRLEEEAERLNSEIETLESVLGQVDALARELSDLERELGDKRRELEAAEELYEALKKVHKLFGGKHPKKIIQEYKSLNEEVKRLNNKKSSVEQAVKSLRDKLGDLKRKAARAARAAGLEPGDPAGLLEALEKMLGQLEEDAERLRRETMGLRSRAASMRGRASDFREKARILEREASGRCPLCGHELSRNQALGIAARLRGEAESLEKKATALEREAERLEAEAKKKEREANRLRGPLEVLRSALESIRQEYGGPEEAEQRLRELEEKLEGLTRRIEELEDRLSSIARHLEEVSRLMSVLEKHGIQEDIDEEMIEDARRRAENLRQEVSQIEGRIKEIRGELESIIESIRGVVRGPIDASKPGKLVDTVQEALKERRGALQELEKRRDTCRGLKAAFQDLDARMRRLSELEGLLEEKRKELDSLESSLTQLNSRIENAWNRINKLREEIGGKRQALEEAKSRVKRLRAEVERLERALYASRVLSFVREVLKRAPEELYEKNLVALERIVSSVIAGFNTKYVEARVVRGEGDDIRFMLASREGISVDLAQLSGGEQTAFGLALVIALNKLLAGNVGFLVLDEPTVHLDEDKRRFIADILREMRYAESGIVDQVIIVSHERSLIDAADSVYRVSYEAGRSVVREEAGAELSLGEG